MLKGLLKPATKPKPPPGSAPSIPPAPAGGASSAIGIAGAYSSTHGVETTARSDVALPHSAHRRERRRSSVAREERAAILKELPLLKDTAPAKKEALFKQKLALCSVLFEWDQAEAIGPSADLDKRAKEIKRVTLLELVDHVNTPGGQKLFTDTVLEEVVGMACVNIFRTLPAPAVLPGGEEVTGSSGGEDGEEEPFLEPSWSHLQLVYEFLLRFIVSAEVKPKTAKKYIDTNFCNRLIEMFDSEDPRERDYLKTILHRIYGKFMSHRSLIRKAISHVFYRFVYETEKHNGVGELLEILGSIINGFALPLKPEHVLFLEKALIPLHHPRSIQSYFQQLCYCVTQYVEKDPVTAQTVIKGLVACWPISSSAKQITLLNELEEVLELAGPEHVFPVNRILFRTLAKCVGSTHFQVAERALFLWNNEQLVTSGILSKSYANDVLGMIYSALTKNASGHWNTTVETLAQNVLKHYHEANPALYERCASEAAGEPAAKAAGEAARKSKWARLEAIAANNASRGIVSASYALPLQQVVAGQKVALAPFGRTPVGGGGGRPLSTSTATILAMSSGGAGRP